MSCRELFESRGRGRALVPSPALSLTFVFVAALTTISPAVVISWMGILPGLLFLLFVLAYLRRRGVDGRRRMRWRRRGAVVIPRKAAILPA